MTLRSAQWYSGDVRNAYIHRAWMRRGVPDDAFDRPQIAIANTASDLVPCNRHLTEVAAAVRDGVLAAGGTPPGVGLGFDPPIYLKPGDVMELGIDRLGRARQNVLGPR